METLSAEKHLVSQFKLTHGIVRAVSAKCYRLCEEQKAPVLPDYFFCALINSSLILHVYFPQKKIQTIFLLDHMDGSTKLS